MKIKQYEIWLADLNPRMGTEAGKKRPVLTIQTDLLNKVDHPATIVCPLTTNVLDEAKLIRVHLEKGTANLENDSDVLIDQIRTIDNKRLLRKLGDLPLEKKMQVKENLLLVLDI